MSIVLVHYISTYLYAYSYNTNTNIPSVGHTVHWHLQEHILHLWCKQDKLCLQTRRIFLATLRGDKSASSGLEVGGFYQKTRLKIIIVLFGQESLALARVI